MHAMTPPTRRSFLRAAAFTTAATLPTAAFAAAPNTPPAPELPNVFGPRQGYTPQIGTFISQLTWMRRAVTGPVSHPPLTVEQLDWLFDKNANSIGAMLLHLAATETYYQMNTFDSQPWDSWSADIKKRWDPAMNLGDAGRSTIKGHPLSFYLDQLKEVRAKSPRRVRQARRRLVPRCRREVVLGPHQQLLQVVPRLRA